MQPHTDIHLEGTPENYETPSLVNPSSALLQDLLKEQRASRGSRGPVSDGRPEHSPSTPDAARVQEDNASTVSDKTRKVNDAFAAGQRLPKEMGMREMDQVGLRLIAGQGPKLTLNSMFLK